MASSFVTPLRPADQSATPHSAGEKDALSADQNYFQVAGRRVSKRLAVAALITILPLLFFYPAVIGQQALAMGDAWLYSVLLRMLTGQMIAQGTLPLWNPYIFGGMPLLAAIQPGVLYPPNWLFAILPVGVAMNAVVILTYHLSLAGGYLYGRALRLNRLSALVSGLAFTFGGFMIGHLEDTNYIAAAAWLPWLMMAIEKLHQATSWRESWRWVIAGSVIVALHIFAGLPQATMQILLISGPYFIFSFLLRRESQQSRQSRLRFLAAGAALAVCGALLAAIQLLPALELQREGERAAISYQTFASFSMTPRFLLSIVFPNFFGGGLPPLYHITGRDFWWLQKWGVGSIGMLGLLLLLAAIFAKQRKGLVRFYLTVALTAMALSLGENLPFELNHLLYRVPVYNLFRGSYRHTFEFTFAASVLAGLGLNSLASLDQAMAKRIFVRCTMTLSLIVSLTVILYLFFAHLFTTPAPISPTDNHLTNPEAFVPLLMFALSVGAVWSFLHQRSLVSSGLIVVMMMVSLASFTWFTFWRTSHYDLFKRLADPPAVQAIKQREADLNSFRMVSYASQPYGPNYEGLNHANLAIARGLRSVSGYDPMRLPRPAALAGKMDIFGMIPDLSVFDARDQAFNLLNVKYLLREHPGLAASGAQVAVKEGISFSATSAALKLLPGSHPEIDAEEFAANELALISSLARSVHIPDEAPIAAIRLHTTDGRVIEQTVLAGRDSSEWAWDRADVRNAIKHRRAHVIESHLVPDESGAFESHSYLARFAFDRAAIDFIELNYLRQDAELMITGMTLTDAVTGNAIPLQNKRLAPERWHLAGRFGEVDLYQNLKVMPRAWFVNRVLAMPRDEVLKTISTGTFSDGQPFNPASAALLETEDFGGRAISLPAISAAKNAAVEVIRSEPQRIRLRTHNEQAGFLVLSEIYYRGWDALTDGRKTPVYRADDTLRGIAVPPGEHQIEFVFRAPSVRTGAVYSGIGLLILFAGSLVIQRLDKNQTAVNLKSDFREPRGER